MARAVYNNLLAKHAFGIKIPRVLDALAFSFFSGEPGLKACSANLSSLSSNVFVLRAL